MQEGLCERPELALYIHHDRFVGRQWLSSHDIYVQCTLALSLSLCLNRHKLNFVSQVSCQEGGLGKLNHALLPPHQVRKTKPKTQLLQINQ